MDLDSKKCLVVLSGGQDSTTCLWWALDRFEQKNISCVSFDYGQRHIVELQSARAVAKLAGVPLEVLTIDTFLQLGGNSLTAKIEVSAEMDQESKLPNSFVPGRNLIFLTYAAAFAYPKKIGNLLTGVTQTDYSGYPDCRENTLRSLEKTINLGMEADFTLHTPLMHLSKSESVLLAQKLGALDALALSHTCYNGSVPPCKTCPACILRAKGFADAQIPDPLLEKQSA